jgi:hypothetical protein
MEQIGDISSKLVHKPQANESSTADIGIPVEQQQSMGDVFDRWRLNQGWNPWDDTTQDLAIASWCHTLDREEIPYTAYSELYERVLKRRSSAITAGKDVPKFGVELMIAEWDGEYGLRNELRQREVDAGRTLSGNAESQCPRCFGTGLENRFDIDGKIIGVITGRACDHRPFEEGELMFKTATRTPAEVFPIDR